MVWMRSATPPRSPADIPSTSSITSTVLLGRPSEPMPMAVLVVSSLMLFASLPAMPAFTVACPSALFRVSLAFTSITSNPSSRQMMRAEDDLPMPGVPLIRTAFLEVSFLRPLASEGACPWMCTACHSKSHWRNVWMSVALPTNSMDRWGLCFSTHSWFSTVSPVAAGALWGPGFERLLPATVRGFAAIAAGAEARTTGGSGTEGSAGWAGAARMVEVALMSANRPSSLMTLVPLSFAWAILDRPHWVPASR
mmetsp:Transcript_687/g.1996  ORF Transcript_687/g.1996 Transcript_687/m.1996 type:complete len:252 (-) Transcript_687:1482-2237(-)